MSRSTPSSWWRPFPRATTRACGSRCGRWNDSRSRAGALHALIALEAPGVRDLIGDALLDRNVLVRAGAVAAAWRLDDFEWAFARTRALAADREPSVRRQVVVGWGRWGTRPVIAGLVERLELEEDPRLHAHIVGSLQRLSGLRHRADPRPWRHWLGQLPLDWRAGDPGPADSAVGERSVSFAGLPVLSDRVTFLIDFSGSLWHPRANGHTRKEIVDVKLAETLVDLPENTEFNVVPYTSRPFPWQERLVPAKRAQKHRALDFFERCHESGRGNFWDAALLALEDPRVDAIVVLTDGAPTGGPHWNLELMFPLLLVRTRFRGVAFDSILVDAPKRLQRHWKFLADATGGRSIAVEWD